MWFCDHVHPPRLNISHTVLLPSGQSPEAEASRDRMAVLLCAAPCFVAPAVLTHVLLQMFSSWQVTSASPPSPSCTCVLSLPTSSKSALCPFFCFGISCFWFSLCGFFLQLCYPVCTENCQMLRVNSSDQHTHPFPYHLTGLPCLPRPFSEKA